MKKIIFIALVFITSIASAESERYVNINIGTGGMETPRPELNDGPGGYEYRGVLGRLSAGYLIGDDILLVGGEVGYAKYADNKLWFGTDECDSLTFKGYDVDLLAVAQWRFDSYLNFKAKGGFAYVHQESVASGLMNSGLEKSHGKIFPEIALSTEYAFESGFTINAAYHYVYGDNPDAVTGLADQNTAGVNKIASVVMLTAGAGYRF